MGDQPLPLPVPQEEPITDDEDPKAEQLVTTDEEEEYGEGEDIPDDEQALTQQLEDNDNDNSEFPVLTDQDFDDDIKITNEFGPQTNASSGDSEEEEEGEIIDEIAELPISEQVDDEIGEFEIEVIKSPRKDILEEWDLDDFDDEPDEDVIKIIEPSASIMSIHISQMKITSVEEARVIAEQVIEVLEEDVTRYLLTAGIRLEDLESSDHEDNNLPRDKISGSSISISSDASIVLPGEPSQVRMFYDKGKSAHRESAIPHLKGDGIDKTFEVTLHRSRKYHGRGRPEKKETYVQTKEMTFVPVTKAQLIFMEMYPKPDDWVPPPLPSRQASMQVAIAAAEKEDPNVDRTRKGPQIINFFNRKKLLQPLRDDYYKDESFWTGSRFRGEYKNRQFSKGHYDHPTGVKYQSEWKDGHFHTDKHLGVMMYPRGDTFEGEWEKGRYVSGDITFGDGLKYTGGSWSYCEAPDRRLRVERYFGIKPAGNTIYNDQYPAPTLPPGCYDVGDGIYNPKTTEVRGYDGFLLRTASIKEQEWIINYCRKAATPDEEYIPTFHEDRFPGSYMEQLQRFSIAKRKYH